METIHGYNKVFFDTGISQLRIALNEQEVEQIIDLMNEAELALSLNEIL